MVVKDCFNLLSSDMLKYANKVAKNLIKQSKERLFSDFSSTDNTHNVSVFDN